MQSRFLPNTAIMTGLNVVKNEQPDLNVEPVLFDPTESFKDSDVSIYQNSVFDLFEKDYEEVTGKKIKLAEGAGFKGVIDLDNEKEVFLGNVKIEVDENNTLVTNNVVNLVAINAKMRVHLPLRLATTDEKGAGSEASSTMPHAAVE